jgi:hypothetical protein
MQYTTFFEQETAFGTLSACMSITYYIQLAVYAQELTVANAFMVVSYVCWTFLDLNKDFLVFLGHSFIHGFLAFQTHNIIHVQFLMTHLI